MPRGNDDEHTAERKSDNASSALSSFARRGGYGCLICGLALCSVLAFRFAVDVLISRDTDVAINRIVMWIILSVQVFLGIPLLVLSLVVAMRFGMERTSIRVLIGLGAAWTLSFLSALTAAVFIL